MTGLKTIPILRFEDEKLFKYTLEELNENFTFKTNPDWNEVQKIYLYTSPFNNKWLEVFFKNERSKKYKNVLGTFVESGY